jgi:hypothetical protein
VWTGSEVVVNGAGFNAVYDPAGDSWQSLSGQAGSGYSVFVWTGRLVLGWGGGCCGGVSAEGVQYDPAASTWRPLPPAQLMMQSGMPVAAESYRAALCSGVFTLYAREEDASLTSGKLDEELARASQIIDAVRPGGLVLFNESFAATNEREGSQIAHHIVGALLDAGIRVAFVTHLYDLASTLHGERADEGLFLQGRTATRRASYLPARPRRHPSGPATAKTSTPASSARAPRPSEPDPAPSVVERSPTASA